MNSDEAAGDDRDKQQIIPCKWKTEHRKARSWHPSLPWGLRRREGAPLSHWDRTVGELPRFWFLSGLDWRTWFLSDDTDFAQVNSFVQWTSNTEAWKQRAVVLFVLYTQWWAFHLENHNLQPYSYPLTWLLIPLLAYRYLKLSKAALRLSVTYTLAFTYALKSLYWWHEH